MRGLIEEAPSPVPLIEQLPGMLQEDPFVQRFAQGFDAVMAPILITLDNLEAYFDPTTAPPDFVEWLCEWVGMALEMNWPVERRRVLAERAVELFRWRGTVRGLAAQVAVYAGSEPVIDESGGAGWSDTPNAPLPGDADVRLVVRIGPIDPSGLDERLLDRIISGAKPAHVPHTVEVLVP